MSKKRYFKQKFSLSTTNLRAIAALLRAVAVLLSVIAGLPSDDGSLLPDAPRSEQVLLPQGRGGR